MNWKSLFTIVALALFATPGWCEQSKTFDNFTVHYNAFSADFLEPEVARTYSIARSKNRGILNIAIRKTLPDTTSTAAEALLEVETITLTQQVWPIVMRKITERDAIYYIGEFPVTHAENLKFHIEVTLPGRTAPIEITHKQQFFTR